MKAAQKPDHISLDTLIHRLKDIEYSTPTTAAKTIVTDWKEVNGWDFWRYLNPSIGHWEKIGRLR